MLQVRGMEAIMKKLTRILMVLSGLLAMFSVADAWQTNTNGNANGDDRALAVTIDGAGDVVAAGFSRNGGKGLDDFTVIKSSGVDGTEFWRQVINGSANGNDQALAVTVDSAGNVIAAGFTTNSGTGSDFTVIKFDGSSGAELWRQVINGTDNRDDQAISVTVGGAGNVIAAGFTTNSSTGRDFTVIKFNGASGAEMWRQVIDGTANSEDQALAVKVRKGGNVVAAGFTTNSGTSRDFTVITFDGAKGNELWRQVINGTANSVDQALAVTVGGAGNVIAAGFTTSASFSNQITVIKFDGAKGTELWRQVVSGFGGGFRLAATAKAVTVDGAGNVIVGGNTSSSGDFPVPIFVVIKLNGSNGTELWRQVIGGGIANAVTVDNARNVIAAGFTTAQTDRDFMVIKFDGASGAELWREVLDGTANGEDQAFAVRADAAGDVVAAGFTRNSDTIDDFTIVKLSGLDGTSLWNRFLNSTSTDSNDVATAVVVDGAGDVIAAGSTGNRGTGVLTNDFSVIKYSGVDGAELWRQVLSGTSTGFDQANAVAVDGAGDVITAGVTENIGTDRDFTVIKFSGVDGTILWDQVVQGSANSVDEADALTIDSAGDVIAAGFTINLPLGRAGFTVIKFTGADGTELWRQVIFGAAHQGDFAHAVAVDGAGDIIAAGNTRNSGSLNDDFTVIKFSGVDGTELWRQAIDGSATNSLDQALAVTVDQAGDVVAAGLIGSAFAVLKFSGADGTELWRRLLSGGAANAVTVDGVGDVIAAGRAGGVSNDFAVFKLSGTTGVQQWSRSISGSATNSFDQALKATVDGAGDVLAAGFIQNTGTGSDFTVIKFSGSNGTEQWRQVFNGTADGSDQALAVTVDALGDVVAAGKTSNTDTSDDFTVVKLRGTDGSDFGPSAVVNISSSVVEVTARK
jgi:uncharacterized delta-60 repeat protein